ncbi:MAG: dTMP kinase [Bacteroidota bacterium]|nr:dTMP kinase [Bacteroidota bacterium]
MTQPNALFLSFEGIDFSGKSTQARLVYEWFRQRDIPAMFVREPGGTALSEEIRRILLDRTYGTMCAEAELFLFSAARAQLVRETILPALSSGIHVIADRFHDSTTAYQGYGRGIDLDAVRAIHRLALNGVYPHITFFFDIPYEESRRRRALLNRPDDRMEAQDETFYLRVRSGYAALAKHEPDRFIVLDGCRPVEEITRTILQSIQERLT